MRVPDELIEAACEAIERQEIAGVGIIQLSNRSRAQIALEAILPKVREELCENAYGGERPCIEAAFARAFPKKGA